MRRRVVCPRSHPASPYLRRLIGRLRYGSRYFPGGRPPGAPMSPFARGCASTSAPPSGLAAPYRWPRAWLAAVRGNAVIGGTTAVRGPASPAAPGAPSWGAAGAAEAVFAGRCGLGAASSLRMRLWRRIFASEPVVAPHLRFSPCRGGQPRLRTAPRLPVSGHARPWRRPRCRCDRGAASASRSPVVHFAHTRDAPSTARGDFRRRGYRPWPRKLSRRTCMCTVPGRDVSPRRNPRPAHIP